VEFSNAVRVARALVKQDETLLIVTADHSHVLTMAGYPTRGNDILGLARGNDDHGNPELTPLRDMIGLPFTTLSYANGPGYTGRSIEQPEGAKRYPHNPTGYAGIRKGRPKLSDAEARDPNYMQEATVPPLCSGETSIARARRSALPRRGSRFRHGGFALVDESR
jgi:alkaline phosphatase